MTLPERADYSLTESALSPFQAEPTQLLVRRSTQTTKETSRGIAASTFTAIPVPFDE